MEQHSSTFKPAVLAGLGFTLLLATAGRAETQSVPCEPSPPVKQALRELPLPSPERASMLETLIDRFPGDLFVNRAFQDATGFPGTKELERPIARYRELAEQHPGDSLYAYLAARALIGVRTKEAITQLEKQLGQWPHFPWPHLDLVKIYQATAFRDPNKARQHLEAFLEACPASLEGYGFLRSMEPSDFTREAAERLRQLIRNATEPEEARAYSALWALEFRLRPSGEHETLRRQVADDVKRLWAADPGNSPDYLLTLGEGYRLAGDTENVEWVREQLRTKFMPKSAGPSNARGEWTKKNPFPKLGDPPEKHRAHQQALVKATKEWVRKWPESFMGQHYRFTAVLRAEEVSAAVVENAAEGLLNAKDKSGTFGILPLELQVAELYAAKGVRPERAAELLAKGIAELERGLRLPAPTDLVPQQGLPDPETGQLRLEWVGWRIAADVALNLEDTCTARDAIQRMNILLRKLKPSGKVDAKDASAALQQYQHADRQAAYWERLGSLAELEGRGMDALVFYQNALVVRPQPKKGMPPGPKDELAEKARLLWKQHGGTDEGWQAWLSRKELGASVAGAPDLLSLWTRLKKPLPDFELTDLAGNKWTLDDLKGKVTFANVWATWCEPCRVEMPHVEKLHEKFKDRKDVLVLTFNIDDNIGLIQPFLEKDSYSFPVLPAKSLVDAVFPSLGIPQNWIIDTNGVLQVMQRGFGPSGEKWTGQMLEAIEKVRTAR